MSKKTKTSESGRCQKFHKCKKHCNCITCKIWLKEAIFQASQNGDLPCCCAFSLMQAKKLRGV